LLALVDHLDDVPTKLRLHWRLRALPLFHREYRLRELWHHLSGREIAKVAAVLLRRGIGRLLLGYGREIGPARQLLDDVLGLILGRHEDMRGTDLRLRRLLRHELCIAGLDRILRHQALEMPADDDLLDYLAGELLDPRLHLGIILQILLA